MYTKDDVARLIEDIGTMKSTKRDDADPNRPIVAQPSQAKGDRPLRYIGNRDVDEGLLAAGVMTVPNLGNLDLGEIEVGEPFCFGLSLDMFDPVSGRIFTVCRPHRGDIAWPQHEIFLTRNQVAVAIAQARADRANSDRALGVVTPEQAEARDKAQKTALAAKNERLGVEQKATDPTMPTQARASQRTSQPRADLR